MLKRSSLMRPISFHHKFIRRKSLSLAAVIFAVMAITLAGCKPKSSDSALPPAGRSDYFKTPFQSECEFIVQTIVSDVAEQMYFAANHDMPDAKSVSVTVSEKRGSPVDTPEYQLQIAVGPKQLTCDVRIDGPIWSSAVYHQVATQIAQAIALKAPHAEQTSDTALLAKLSDSAAETIEHENQRLSAALEQDFSNPELHEQAALLLGAFLLRDHSGKFFEVRSPLCRLTAHLVMADFFRGDAPAGINGQLAEAAMLTLANDESQAVEKLNAIGTNNSAALPMVRTLLARNTGDYRPLEKLRNRSHLESIAWFLAASDYVDVDLAWPKLGDDQKQTVDFVRIANTMNYSVAIGHQLLASSIPLEMQEVYAVYNLSHGESLNQKDLISALNEEPERCFSRSGDEVHVRIIGWGQWADFLQRHLCHAIQQNFAFMDTRWGVHDDAKDFAAQSESFFGGLRLYPFVRRFNCTDEKSYHKAEDDGFKVTIATPHLVPAECWNYLCYRVPFAPPYNPSPNPHVNEWHSHNPPPGTVYDLSPRLDHPSLISRSDAVARFEQLHDWAPYDPHIIHYLLEHKYKNEPTYDQAAKLFSAVLPYSINAMRTLANTVYKQPQQYEKLMLQAAALDPACYYMLGDYEIDRQQEDLAAEYIDKACAADPDTVRAANHSYWRVRYYLKKGQTEKARQIADAGAQTYSGTGLEAKAYFLEKTFNYDQAFKWYTAINERYDDPKPLIAFCERYKDQTGNNRFDPLLDKLIKKLFPSGMEKVSLRDFQGPPTDGVSVLHENSLVTAAGLRTGDVIVALNGTRTHNFTQYMVVRDLLNVPELDLIVWQGSAYHELKANPPNHKFGVNFGDYHPE